MVGLKELSALSDKLRLDPKYFCKAAVSARQIVEKKQYARLGSITSVMRKGIFDIKADTYTEAGDGFPFVRIADLKNGLTRENPKAWISVDAHNKENATALNFGDIVISKTAYPAAALVTLPECNVSQDTIATKLSSQGSQDFDSAYIVAFLNSKIGMALMEAEFQGNVQEHFGLTDAKRLPIPRLSATFQARVKKSFQQSIACLSDATLSEANAEAALERSLGLATWKPPVPLTYQARAKAVQLAGRLDAEYFAPKIRELIGLLGKSGKAIRDVTNSRREKFDASLSGVFNYIEIGDLPGDGTADSTSLDRSDAPSRATWHVNTGDVITSTVRPIRRLSALIEVHQDGFVCSSGLVVLQPTAVRPEVLLTYLRLPVFCELMDLHTSASMYPAISEKDLLNLPFAPPDPEKETAICDAVMNARKARRRAAELLEAAKRAVEIAIEQDEAAALRFLDEIEN